MPKRSPDARVDLVEVVSVADIRPVRDLAPCLPRCRVAMLGEAAAQDPSTNPAKLMRLARSRNASLRELVAQNSSTPPAALAAMASESVPGVVRAVAGNPASPRATLGELVQSRDEAVRVAVYANPSTPPTVLADILNARGLTTSERVAAAGNPSTPDATLSRLTWHDAPEQVKLAVAANESASAKTLSDLFGGRDPEAAASRALSAALAGNRATPTPVRARLFRVEALRPVILANPPFEPASKRIAHARSRYNDGGLILELLAHDPEPEVRRAVGVSPTSTEKVLRIVAADDDPIVADVATARLSHDSEELRRLALSKDPFVLEALSRNAQTPTDLRPNLARAITATAGEDLLEKFGQDRSTPTDVLKTLATHPSKSVRQAVVSSPSTPVDVISILVSDVEPAIRSRAASVSGLSTEFLVCLASDADPGVRTALAANRSTPVALLLRLAADEAPNVVEAAAMNPNATSAVLERVVTTQIERWKDRTPKPTYFHDHDKFPLAPLAAAAASELTPAESLGSLMASLGSDLDWRLTSSRNETGGGTEASIWVRIASNPSSPADTLDKIARRVRTDYRSMERPSSGIRALESFRESILRRIVLNPSTSIATLEFLADARWVARRTIEVSDRELSSGYRTEWSSSGTGAATADTAKIVRREIARRQWTDETEGPERLLFAANPDSPSEILARLAQDPQVDVRCAVAANPSTSVKTFRALAEDPSELVRLAAAAATHPDPASYAHEPYGSRGKQRESAYRAAFERLSVDAEPAVRLGVARNSGIFWGTISKDARSQMVLDSNSELHSEVVATLSTTRDASLTKKALRHTIRRGNSDTWRTLAKSYYGLTPEILELLVDTGDSSTAILVAQYYNTSIDLLVRLASATDAAVIEAVASRRFHGPGSDASEDAVTQALVRNALTPGSVIQGLASKPVDDQTLAAIAQHPNLPESALLAHAEGSDPRWMRAAVTSGSTRAVVAVASNPKAPAELLELAAASGDPQVHAALTVNETTSPELLVRLIERGATAG